MKKLVCLAVFMFFNVFFGYKVYASGSDITCSFESPNHNWWVRGTYWCDMSDCLLGIFGGEARVSERLFKKSTETYSYKEEIEFKYVRRPNQNIIEFQDTLGYVLSISFGQLVDDSLCKFGFYYSNNCYKSRVSSKLLNGIGNDTAFCSKRDDIPEGFNVDNL